MSRNYSLEKGNTKRQKIRICHGGTVDCLKKYIESRDSPIEGVRQHFCVRCLGAFGIAEKYTIKKPEKPDKTKDI